MNQKFHLCVGLFIIGLGSSDCVSRCDIDPSLCGSRAIELKTRKIDKGAITPTGNMISLRIPGALLNADKIARLVAPVPADAPQPSLVDMAMQPETELGDYMFSIDANIGKLDAGCVYYLNVFAGQPSYQIVDDICKYSITVTSGEVKWSPIPYSMPVLQPASIGMGNRGLWIYKDNTMVLQVPVKIASSSSSHYIVTPFDGKILKTQMEFAGLSPDSFAYFRNDQGIIADYESAASQSPDILLTLADTGQLAFNRVSSLDGFGHFSALAMDGKSTFFAAVSTDGALRVWNYPIVGVAVQRAISMSPQVLFKKLAVIRQNRQPNAEMSDLIVFDSAGSAQVFLQQTDGSFVYDKDLSMARKDLGSGAVTALAVGDVDGDGVNDLAIVREQAKDTITFYLNRGDGSFKAAPTSLRLPTATQSVSALAIGPIGAAGSPGLNNLAVLDTDTNVYIYQNQTRDSCSFSAVPCGTSPATMNAR